MAVAQRIYPRDLLLRLKILQSPDSHLPHRCRNSHVHNLRMVHKRSCEHRSSLVGSWRASGPFTRSHQRRSLLAEQTRDTRLRQLSVKVSELQSLNFDEVEPSEQMALTLRFLCTIRGLDDTVSYMHGSEKVNELAYKLLGLSDESLHEIRLRTCAAAQHVDVRRYRAAYDELCVARSHLDGSTNQKQLQAVPEKKRFYLRNAKLHFDKAPAALPASRLTAATDSCSSTSDLAIESEDLVANQFSAVVKKRFVLKNAKLKRSGMVNEPESNLSSGSFTQARGPVARVDCEREDTDMQSSPPFTIAPLSTEEQPRIDVPVKKRFYLKNAKLCGA